jgi:hypothetical protein
MVGDERRWCMNELEDIERSRSVIDKVITVIVIVLVAVLVAFGLFIVYVWR